MNTSGNRVTGCREYSLIVEIPDKEQQEKDFITVRQNRLTNKLIQITEECHTKFLKDLMDSRPDLKEYLATYDVKKQK